jgi:hypothetical protein
MMFLQAGLELVEISFGLKAHFIQFKVLYFTEYNKGRSQFEILNSLN